MKHLQNQWVTNDMQEPSLTEPGRICYVCQTPTAKSTLWVRGEPWCVECAGKHS